MLSSESRRASKLDIVLIVFGVLDAFAFVRLLPLSIRMVYGRLSTPGQYTTFLFYAGLLQLALHISYFFSTYGFLRRRKWAFILYYCQFPVRLLFFSVSLGFLSYINRPFDSLTLHYILGIVMLSAEIARLVLTAMLHNRTRRRESSNQIA